MSFADIYPLEVSLSLICAYLIFYICAKRIQKKERE